MSAESRSEMLRQRVTPGEKRLFERAAKRERRTVSDWARLAMLERASRNTKGEA